MTVADEALVVADAESEGKSDGASELGETLGRSDSDGNGDAIELGVPESEGETVGDADCAD
jgi:hypothetical protein